ncbi:MAG: type IV pilin protein [Stenotrophobium sp.]
MDRQRPRKTQTGFTLIELMVAVVVAGILASIAIPSYRESVARANRAQAQAALLGLAQAMERYFTRYNSYQVADPDSVNDDGTPAIYPANVPGSGAPFYRLSVKISADGSDYSIQAVPVSGGAQAGDKCGSFTYDAGGAQGISGGRTGIAVDDCWK